LSIYKSAKNYYLNNKRITRKTYNYYFENLKQMENSTPTNIEKEEALAMDFEEEMTA